MQIMETEETDTQASNKCACEEVRNNADAFVMKASSSESQQIPTIEPPMKSTVTTSIGDKSVSKTHALGQTFHRELTYLRRLQNCSCIIAILFSDKIKHSLTFPRYTCDLLQRLIQKPHMVALFDCVQVAKNLSTALSYCHSQRIVHNDVKGENVLIQLRNEHIEKCVLCDFDQALELSSPAEIRYLSRFSGTYAYAPPEKLSAFACSLQTDIWGFGMVLFCAVQKEMPFDEEDEEDEHGHMLPRFDVLEFDENSWRNFPLTFQETIEQCLSLDYKQRPAIAVIEDLMSSSTSSTENSLGT